MEDREPAAEQAERVAGTPLPWAGGSPTPPEGHLQRATSRGPIGGQRLSHRMAINSMSNSSLVVGGWGSGAAG